MIWYHKAVIADRRRVEIFARAIEQIVGPGDVVADVGTGTGIMSCVACRAGARKVYAIDRTDAVTLAREVARANGYADRIQCIQADALTVELPEQVDVVLGDVIGVAGVEDDIVRIMARMARTYLKPGGRVLPRTMSVYFAPWQAAAAYEDISFWDERHANLDFRPLREYARNTPISVEVPRDGALAAPSRAWSFVLGESAGTTLDARLSFEVDTEGTAHGLAAWFSVELADGIEFSTGPKDIPTVWRQALFVLDRPTPVRPGDRVDVELTGGPGNMRLLLGWTGRISRGQETVATFSGHMIGANLLPLPAMELVRSGRLPKTGPMGHAAAWVLARLDGLAMASDLAPALAAAMPELFGSTEAARNFIAHLAIKYGEGPY